ncbi:MAG: TauD/TfdA family dioxygenase [Betaproteobacteria bacterium]|nr:TauD/TfdA family dioxygenase [Betaproteobacteria bacterium]
MSPAQLHVKISDPAAWIGPHIQHDASWVYTFDQAAIAELDAALRHAKRAAARIPFDAALFPLPRLRATLDAILGDIEHGMGFKLLRGIPRARYSDADCEMLYWGLGAHFGTPVSQNARGHLLGHVRDEGRTQADPNARAYQTNQRMDFHTDILPIDVLGLFCLRTARRGGASKLTSALTIHNVLREERPDLLAALYGDFHIDWRGEEPAGEAPWFTLPMFSERAGKITSRIVSLPYYDSAARHGGQYAPSALQREALEMVQQIANRPELMLTMHFEEGDIQLINNHTMLHAREAYEDWPEPGRERHLLRMWIAVDDAKRRPLADALTARYGWVQRGGIPVKQVQTA